MYYLFFGSDREKARTKAREVLSAMKKKRPAAEIFNVNPSNWDQAGFEAYIGSQGLFDNKFIVFCDSLFERPETREWLVARSGEIKNSENGFVFLDSKIDVASLKKMEKDAVKTEKFDITSKGDKWRKTGGGESDRFNVFSLADALGNRDRKKLWVLYEQALMKEVAPEEINGVLFWQIKSIILAKTGATATETGLSPFVFSKSKRFATNYSETELNDISRQLVVAYHDAHRGIHDFDIALERLILSI